MSWPRFIGVNNGAYPGSDHPRDGCCCRNHLGVGSLESVTENFPPIVVLGEDYKGGGASFALRADRQEGLV